MIDGSKGLQPSHLYTQTKPRHTLHPIVKAINIWKVWLLIFIDPPPFPVDKYEFCYIYQTQFDSSNNNINIIYFAKCCIIDFLSIVHCNSFIQTF